MQDEEMSRKRAERPLPLLRLLGYYTLVVAIGAVLIRSFPMAEQAFVAPIHTLAFDVSRSGAADAAAQEVLPPPWRAVLVGLAAIGIVALVAPVAWVYMYTRRFRYDRALVQSMMVLPIVVGGMVMIVKTNIAIAFALAGIVAAVRFRNTLKDPRDAVYIFLALGLGIAAGVHALDIALVLSLTFNLLVLGLWKHQLTAMYAVERRGGTFAMGNPAVRLGRTASERDVLRSTLESPDSDADGALIVQGSDLATVRTATEAALSGNASEWEFREASTGAQGTVVLPVLVKFKKKGTPIDVLGELDEYWARHIISAEYLPFATRQANGEKK
jgi:hypothetical protein